MVEDVVSREVFLGDLICGRFMNSNSEVTDTVDFPDLAWLALDLGETRVTLIGILFSENQSLVSIFGKTNSQRRGSGSFTCDRHGGRRATDCCGEFGRERRAAEQSGAYDSEL